jgi:hexosaminidase
VKLACGVVSSCLVKDTPLTSLVVSGVEFIDGTNVISTTWPRAATVAERLWSAADVTDAVAATPRLEEHRCRYIKRGIPASPASGPSYCEYEFDP